VIIRAGMQAAPNKQGSPHTIRLIMKNASGS
jgi:hypothetical protein